ncbi:MAG: DUF4058 family protein [Caldilineaceae bacterium]|nr:DUF4058 family protein [Caldilineaceae bacterium]
MVASPFPGMDPYLESPDIWADVHSRLINVIAEQLSPVLAPKYLAELNTQVAIEAVEDYREVRIGAIPDVAVTKQPISPTTGGLQILEAPAPAPKRMKVALSYEITLLTLQIRRQSDKRLVAAIELLSPINKRIGPDRTKYLKKRESYFESGIHLVELDFLRRYPRMPFEDELPECDYVVMVFNAYEGLECDVWPLSIRQQLPVISIPLVRPDTPVTLDLGTALRTVYERARYDLRIDYTQPTVPPLPLADAQWVELLRKHLDPN